MIHADRMAIYINIVEPLIEVINYECTQRKCKTTDDLELDHPFGGNLVDALGAAILLSKAIVKGRTVKPPKAPGTKKK